MLTDGWWTSTFVTDDGDRARKAVSSTDGDGDAKTAGNEIAIDLVGDKLAGDCVLTVVGVSSCVVVILSPRSTMLFDWRLSFSTCVSFFITLPSIFNFEFCSEGGFVVVERYISRLIVVETIIIVGAVVVVVSSIVMVGKKVFFDAAK